MTNKELQDILKTYPENCQVSIAEDQDETLRMIDSVDVQSVVITRKQSVMYIVLKQSDYFYT